MQSELLNDSTQGQCCVQQCVQLRDRRAQGRPSSRDGIVAIFPAAAISIGIISTCSVAKPVNQEAAWPAATACFSRPPCGGLPICTMDWLEAELLELKVSGTCNTLNSPPATASCSVCTVQQTRLLAPVAD